MRKVLALFAVAALGVAGPSLGADGAQKPRPFTNAEIEKALVGKSIYYDPPNTGDLGVMEDFHRGGVWSGILYGRAPFPIRGHWTIEADRLCVLADPGTMAARVHSGKFCRTVWGYTGGSGLFMVHLDDSDPPHEGGPLGMGLQTLNVSDLPAS